MNTKIVSKNSPETGHEHSQYESLGPIKLQIVNEPKHTLWIVKEHP